MSERERYCLQKKSSIKRKKIVRLEKQLLVLAALMIFVVAAAIFTGIKVQADSSDKVQRDKVYTEVTVDHGDSLWDIATAHITEEYYSVNDYIDEIMELNSIYDAKTIHYGQHIIVPYYR